MNKSFQIENVKCQGCANSLKKSLKDISNDINIDLTLTPRVLTIDIDDSQIDILKMKLKELGYPLSSEKLSSFDTIKTKSVSFISCAIGRASN